jgi:RNA-binding motif protein, X-linked 2
MNPLTQIKNTQKASKYEIAQGFSESASWHARFKHSAYIFAGGLPFDLTEGDLLAIFAQYGELVDINLVKDKDTGARGPHCSGMHADVPGLSCACGSLQHRQCMRRAISQLSSHLMLAGKPRGFAFAAYEDQRSTVLAVDNLSGARVAGRTIRVEHVDNYKRKKAEVRHAGRRVHPVCSKQHRPVPEQPTNSASPRSGPAVHMMLQG